MTIPLRVQPGVGEGIASYLRRVAHTLGTTPRMLAIDLDLTCGETTGLLLGPDTTHAIAERLGLRPDDLDDLQLARWHPVVLWFPPNRGGLSYAAARSGAVLFS